jgi:subtilase family protein
LNLPYERYAEVALRARTSPEAVDAFVQKMKTAAGPAEIAPGISTVPPERVRERVAQANARAPKFRALHDDLLRFFRVALPDGMSPEHAIGLARTLPGVTRAYVSRGRDPQIAGIADPAYVDREQCYLENGTVGIGAEKVWPWLAAGGVNGGDGAGTRLVDVEQGWALNHPDLPTAAATPLCGTNDPASMPHGTSVLGVICAQPNTMDVVGIVPKVGEICVASWVGNNIASAIAAATEHLLAPSPAGLPSGGVILVEYQADIGELRATVMGLPAEAEHLAAAEIRTAVSLGIVVIEAAGNGGGYGGYDLAGQVDDEGRSVWARPAGAATYPDDSGAIMVAAAVPYVRTRVPDSNYGTRIDCFAWGRRVITCQCDTTGKTIPYAPRATPPFELTSAASAIIAGAALSVQGMATASGRGPFAPSDLRAVLKDPATGTDSPDPGMGIMPDVERIARAKGFPFKP